MSYNIMAENTTTHQQQMPLVLAKVENGALFLDNESLFTFLQDIGSRPIAIISIAGAFRSGKSFLMNFILRYLRNKGWKNPDWVGTDSTVITGEFPWRNGPKACTQGINAWPEVFKVPTSSGQEISVIIVDTQGLFDNKTSPDVNAKLMSLSTLFSSHQILNLMRQLEERDLEHLQLCVELAKVAGSIGRTNREKPFQKLTFLVRDWEHDERRGDNTDGYLREWLTEKSQSADVRELTQSVPESFDHVSCTLLPHPGKKVTKPKDDRPITNKDIDEDFLEDVVEFVDHILNPKNLVIKRSTGGGQQSPDGLIQLLATVGNAFKSGKVPTAETLLQSVTKGNNGKARVEAVLKYKEMMEEKCKSALGILSTKRLEEYDRTSRQQAIKRFHSIANIGTDTSKAKYLELMENECQAYFVNFTEKNKLEKDKKELEFEKLRTDCLKDYKLGVRKKMEHSASQKDLQTTHENSKKTAMNRFNSAAQKVSDVLPAIEDMAKTLKDDIQSEYDHQKRKLESSALEKEITSEFEEELEKHESYYEENLADILKRLRKDFSEKYDKKIGHQFRNTKRFEETMDGLIEKASKRNESNHEAMRKQYGAIGSRFADNLDGILRPMMLKVYIAQSVFDPIVIQFMREKVETDDGYKAAPGWCQKIIDDAIKEKEKKLRDENEENKPHREVTISTWKKIKNFLAGVIRFVTAPFRWFGRLFFD